MRILQLYNNYLSGGGGETTMVHITEDVLRQHGHVVETFTADNRQIIGASAKAKAFITGIWSVGAANSVAERIRAFKPDVVHIWNLYPLLSPSVIRATRECGVPVVMGVQNYQLSCPTASHYSHGEICTRCIGGHESQCMLHNCKSNLPQSVGYGLRSMLANQLSWYRDTVSRFLAVSGKVRTHMLANGYADREIRVVPNCVQWQPEADRSAGEYVGFVGRVTPEKGIDVLLAAARQSGVPVRIAGNGPAMDALRAAAPASVDFVGMLDREGVADFYRRARIIVVPSVWDEPFGLVAPEAMSHSLPVVAARSGGLEDIVLHGETGFLYARHDSQALADHLRRLWDSPALCAQFGAAGYRRAMEEYSTSRYYDRVLNAYTESLAERPMTVI